jgi:hypothetical protein
MKEDEWNSHSLSSRERHINWFHFHSNLSHYKFVFRQWIKIFCWRGAHTVFKLFLYYPRTLFAHLSIFFFITEHVTAFLCLKDYRRSIRFESLFSGSLPLSNYSYIFHGLYLQNFERNLPAGTSTGQHCSYNRYRYFFIRFFNINTRTGVREIIWKLNCRREKKIGSEKEVRYRTVRK